MKAFLRILIVLVIIGGCLGAVGTWYAKRSGAPAVSYRTVPVERGDVLSVISATGTLEPEEVVDVGAQVQGQIVNFGPDPAKISRTVDYNTEVNQGDILAQIDDVLYRADVEQAQANLDSAKANVAKALADLEQFKAKKVQAELDWKRAQNTDKNVLAQADIDAFKAAYDSGVANVNSAQASVDLANAGVKSATATFNRASKNLSYCTIKSPVKGVIIDRRVNIGQTVVSSLNAPSLFLIAKDLTKMQIWASVNEADIGKIKEEQAVNFTVDKVPGRTFHGKVGKIRMNAQTTQNVVTYTVEITYDNSDKALIPYLTTNVSFQVDQHDDVLMVPNAALRWAPTSAAQVSPEARSATAPASGRSTTQPAGDPAAPKAKRNGGGSKNHGTVWVQDGAFVKPIRVKLGLTDGTNTEVSADELKEGMQVISSEARPEDAGSGDMKNPFMPQFNRGGAGGGGRRGG